jgi:hypothetical protein
MNPFNNSHWQTSEIPGSGSVQDNSFQRRGNKEIPGGFFLKFIPDAGMHGYQQTPFLIRTIVIIS